MKSVVPTIAQGAHHPAVLMRASPLTAQEVESLASSRPAILAEVILLSLSVRSQATVSSKNVESARFAVYPFRKSVIEVMVVPFVTT